MHNTTQNNPHLCIIFSNIRSHKWFPSCSINHQVNMIFPCVSPCRQGLVCEGGGHLPVDQLPVCLPVCYRIRSGELLHHSGGDEEDEEGEGQWGGQEGGFIHHTSPLRLNREGNTCLTQCLSLVARQSHYSLSTFFSGGMSLYYIYFSIGYIWGICALLFFHDSYTSTSLHLSDSCTHFTN